MQHQNRSKTTPEGLSSIFRATEYSIVNPGGTRIKFPYGFKIKKEIFNQSRFIMFKLGIENDFNPN